MTLPIKAVDPATGQEILIVGVDFSREDREQLGILALSITEDGEIWPVRLERAYVMPDDVGADTTGEKEE